MPTGSERTVWGMGDGSTLPDVFRLLVDTSARPAVVTTADGFNPLQAEPLPPPLGGSWP